MHHHITTKLNKTPTSN